MARSPQDPRQVVFAVVVETSHGSIVRAVGCADALGRWEPRSGLTLKSSGNHGRWAATATIPQGTAVEYKFVILAPDGTVTWENGSNRLVTDNASGVAEVQTQRFRTVAAEVTSIIHRGGGQFIRTTEDASDGLDRVSFEAVCTVTVPGDTLRVTGSSGSLGGWIPKRGLQLTTTSTSFPKWSGTVQMPRTAAEVEWKLVITHADGSELWEPGNNRKTRFSCSDCHAQGEAKCILIRVWWGGLCSAPESKVGLPRGNSLPGEACMDEDVAPLQRSCTDMTGSTSLAETSWANTARELAPVPRRPTATSPDVGHPKVMSEGFGRWENSQAPGVGKPMRHARSCSLLDHVGIDEGEGRELMALHPRQNSMAVSAEEQQMFVFTAGGDAPPGVADTVVEVVIETNDSRHRLRHETQGDCAQAHWVLSIAETGLSPGLYHLHFLVGGTRALSRDLPIIGFSNVVLFNDSLRRYILANDHQCQNCKQTPSNFTTTKTLDGHPWTSTEEVELAPGKRCGGLARPYSFIGNLAALGDEEEEVVESKPAPVQFDPQVFEGLYGRELRLRMDGYVLPERGVVGGTQSPAPTTNDGHLLRPLRFWPGASILKKQAGACEDAYFATHNSMGVADGVGCMVQFASYGINAAAYAAELMENAAAALEESRSSCPEAVSTRSRSAVAAAELQAKAYGASTICVLTLHGATVGVANLGDSGFMHLRKGQHGMGIVRKSDEQQHSWNCPYQLTRLPPALMSKFPKLALDTAADCEEYTFEVREGDLILMFSDGLRDNLHDHEVLHIVDCALSPAFSELMGLPEHSTHPDSVARALALAAKERSLDPVAKVPFVEYSKKHGYDDCQGGKQDDITVVAAWLVPEQCPVSDAAIAAASATAEPQPEMENPEEEAELDEDDIWQIKRKETMDVFENQKPDTPACTEGLVGEKTNKEQHSETMEEKPAAALGSANSPVTTCLAGAAGNQPDQLLPSPRQRAMSFRGKAVPKYDTPRRGLYELPVASPKSAGRMSACRAKFRPLSRSKGESRLESCSSGQSSTAEADNFNKSGSNCS